MKTIAICTNKGGAAKSTTAINLAFNLRRRGNRVLVVDCDSQVGSLSLSLVGSESPAFNTAVMITDGCTPFEAVTTASNDWLNLHYIAGSKQIAGAEIRLASEPGSESRLKAALNQLDNEYDYCIIDTPPTRSLIVFNALIAANYVLVPVSVGILDFAGITGIMELIEQVKKYSNPNLQLLGILLTRWTKNKLAKDLEKKIRGLFPNKVFQTVIPEAVATGVSWANKLPLTTSAPDSPATLAYLQATQEILNHEHQKRIAG